MGGSRAVAVRAAIRLLLAALGMVATLSDPTAAIEHNPCLPRLLLVVVADALAGVGALLLGRATDQSARDLGWSGVSGHDALGAVLFLATQPAPGAGPPVQARLQAISSPSPG